MRQISFKITRLFYFTIYVSIAADLVNFVVIFSKICVIDLLINLIVAVSGNVVLNE